MSHRGPRAISDVVMVVGAWVVMGEGVQLQRGKSMRYISTTPHLLLRDACGVLNFVPLIRVTAPFQARHRL